MVRVSDVPEGIEVYQLLCGCDIAVGQDPVSFMASQMANYVYVLVDASKDSGRSAVVIDCCWDVDGILRQCREDLNVKHVAAAVYTHRHFDHTGGHLPRAMTRGQRVTVLGLHTFLERGVPVAVGRDDVEAVAKQSGVDVASIRALGEGDSVTVSDGPYNLTVLHTPGHTTGSICFQLTSSEAAGKAAMANKFVSVILVMGDG